MKTLIATVALVVVSSSAFAYTDDGNNVSGMDSGHMVMDSDAVAEAASNQIVNSLNNHVEVSTPAAEEPKQDGASEGEMVNPDYVAPASPATPAPAAPATPAPSNPLNGAGIDDFIQSLPQNVQDQILGAE